MIYLDNASTTKVDPKVVEAVNPYFTENYGNASSSHSMGGEAKDALEKSRESIAKSIGANAEEIVFTSGGTESNNLAVQEIAYTHRDKGQCLITTQIEHDSVLNVCKILEKDGFKVNYLDVNNEGCIDLEKLGGAITKGTTLVSVMHANNEIGTIQNIKEIGKICNEKNVLFHTDACQSYTKEKLDVKNVDLIALNSHKVHGPKGVGVLFVKSGTKLHPLFHGGGHEFGLRSGTENIPGIVGLAKAVEMAGPSHVEHMKKLRKVLIDGVLEISDVTLNGNGLCSIANFSIKNVQGESVVQYLDENGICASTGSACTTTSMEPSHVLRAIGLSVVDAHSAVRFSLSRFNTIEDIDKVIEVLPGIVDKLRKVSPLGN